MDVATGDFQPGEHQRNAQRLVWFAPAISPREIFSPSVIDKIRA
jgi:hypothetical protein